MALRRQSNPQSQALFQLTNGKKYDPDQVYSASTDGRGHYEQRRVKITPGIDHLISEIAGTHDEFRSSEDFIRNAIFHSVHQWITDAPEPDPRLVSALKAEQATAVMEQNERFTKAHTDAITGATESINRCLETHDWNELNDLADMMDEYACDENIPSGIRNQYQQAADDARDTLIKEVKARKRRK